MFTTDFVTCDGNWCRMEAGGRIWNKGLSREREKEENILSVWGRIKERRCVQSSETDLYVRHELKETKPQ